MKNKICSILLIINSICYGQVGLASLNQIPILLHPSMIGSNEGKRISGAYSVSLDRFGSYYDYQKNNYTISGEWLSKRLGSGLGGYINFAKIPNQSGATYNYMAPYSK